MAQLKMPAQPLASEPIVQLYNQCRAHVVLLVELENKLKKLEYERSLLMMRKQGGPAGAVAQQAHAIGGVVHSGKRGRGDGGNVSHKRSHH